MVNKTTKAGWEPPDWVFIATALVRPTCQGPATVAKLYYLSNPTKSYQWPAGHYWTAKNVFELTATATSNPTADPFNMGGIDAHPTENCLVYVLSEGTKPGGGQNDTLYTINICTHEYVSEVSTAGHSAQWWGLTSACDGSLYTIQRTTNPGEEGGTLINFDPANPASTSEIVQSLSNDYPMADTTILYDQTTGLPYIGGFATAPTGALSYITNEGLTTYIEGITTQIGGVAANMYEIAGQGCEWGMFVSGTSGPQDCDPSPLYMVQTASGSSIQMTYVDIYGHYPGGPTIKDMGKKPNFCNFSVICEEAQGLYVPFEALERDHRIPQVSDDEDPEYPRDQPLWDPNNQGDPNNLK
ncbi:MAG: hypothetical protein H6707_05800 [Deltaproteobacteria bacterium]|nr:hypothetical protein [Deltaproteobacteria bacterium]